MKEKIINFIKYNNATAIAITLVLVSTMGVMASEDLRNTVIGEKVVIEIGVDNTQLLQADLDNFDLQMTIVDATEDNNNYYIDYQFQTIGIDSNIWQELSRTSQLIVAKVALAGRDLGLYVQEELSEVADNELAYLEEVQEAEQEKGKTEIIETVEYTGLIGLVLDIKNKVLPGYKPVVEPPEVVIQQPSEETQNESLPAELQQTQTCEGYQFYLDADSDGYGDANNGASGCEVIEGYVLNHDDCDDSNPDINSTVTEICDDGIDNNCDGQTDENCEVSSEETPPVEEPPAEESTGVGSLLTEPEPVVEEPPAEEPAPEPPAEEPPVVE